MAFEDVTPKERIYILDSKKAFELAENFKKNLENNNYRVSISTYGMNGVRIRGTKNLNKLK